MKRFLLVLYIGCLFVVSGCFFARSGRENLPVAGEDAGVPALAQAQVSIRLRLHDEILRQSLRAQTAPAAVFSLRLIDRGNAASPVYLMRKHADITPEGTATVTFASVPAVPVIASLELEGASIVGAGGVLYRSFHGGADLLPAQNNEVVIVASGSFEPEDVLARAALLSIADYAVMTNISSALFANLAEVASNTPLIDRTSADKIFANYKTTLGALSITQVSGGSLHSMAVRSDGTLIAWGNNAYGQLARADVVQSLFRKFSPFTRRVVSCAGGDDFTLLLGADGKVYACGNNDLLQLGISGQTSTACPLEIDSLTVAAAPAKIAGIAAGYNHALAFDIAGNLYSWGSNDKGQLGLGNVSAAGLVAQPVPGITSVKAVAAGNRFSLVLKTDGTVWGCGDNGYSQLATDTGELLSSFVQISLPVTATSIAAGLGHSMALGSDGKVYSWGLNAFGQTGLATTTAVIELPREISGLSSIKQLVAGDHHSLFLGNNALLYGCGDNTNAQLASSDTSPARLSPVQLTFFTNSSLIGASANNSFAIEPVEKLYAWGANDAGQVGNGQLSVTGGVSTPVSIAASW